MPFEQPEEAPVAGQHRQSEETATMKAKMEIRKAESLPHAVHRSVEIPWVGEPALEVALQAAVSEQT